MTIKKILEEYHSTITATDSFVGKVTSEIFKNPTQKELATFKAEKYLRFIAISKTKTVYIFNADMLHEYASKKLRLGYPYGGAIYGEAGLSGGKFYVSDSFMLYHLVEKNPSAAKKLVDADWKWLDKYLAGIDGFLKEVRNQLKEVDL